MDIRELISIGLSEKEAKVYLASLELGKSSVQKIAQKAEVKRATTYVVIQALMKKGLMGSLEQNKKTFFFAESPDNLLSLIRIQERELEEKERRLKRMIPEMLALYDSSDKKPKVCYYEGTEGLKSVQQEYLKVKKKEIWTIFNADHFSRFSPRVGADEYTKERARRGIKGRVIYISKHGPIKSLESDKKKLRQSKRLPYKDFPFEADFTIFDNKVSIEAYDDKVMGVVIEDDRIADSMRTLFNAIWKSI